MFDGRERWLITGGVGFFGAHMAERLLRAGIRPVLLDVAPLEDPALIGRVEFVQADVRDARAVGAAMAGISVVVHAAAALPRERPADVRAVTVQGTRNVYTAARDHGVKRCVYVGTTAVYGVPDIHPIPETAPMRPLGPYGEAKWQAEQIGREMRSAGLHVTILRPKTFIGTGRLGVFQILFDWILAGKRIPVLGDGRNRYQLLEVTDLCEAVWLAARADVPADDYNVGATRFDTVRADLGALCAHAATGARVRPVPAGPARSVLRALDRAGLSPLYPWVYETADKDSFLDVSKIERQLGWRPAFSNAEMLCNTYDWYVREGSRQTSHGGTGHRTAWKQGALRLLRAIS